MPRTARLVERGCVIKHLSHTSHPGHVPFVERLVEGFYSKLYEISSFGEIYYRILFYEIRQWSYVHPMDYKMNNHTLDMKTAFENNDDVALVILRNRNLLNSHTKKWLSRYFDRLEQPEKYDIAPSRRRAFFWTSIVSASTFSFWSSPSAQTGVGDANIC